VELIASRFLYSDDREPRSYREWEHFYKRTVWLYRARTRGILRRYVKGTEHVIDMCGLHRFLRSLRPAVIHYQQTPIPWVDRWFLAGLKRVAPVISTVHNTVPFHGDGPWLARRGFGVFLSRLDHLIVHTEYSRRQLVDVLGIRNSEISVLCHPLFDQYENDASAIGADLATPSDEEREAVVLFFGNISHYKGLDVLIRAFGRLPKKILKRTKLLVAGNPQIPIQALKQLAVSQNVQDRITWQLGYVPKEKVHSIFAQATIVALPYRHIDGSGVLATALCYGKPLIASRIGIFGEVLREGVHGCLVGPEDSSDLADKLAWMLSDGARLTAMGDAVRSLGDSWPSWDVLAAETIRIYQRLDRAGDRKF
jgi:glycosyltransferase involved in cell wall biosynthesis